LNRLDNSFVAKGGKMELKPFDRNKVFKLIEGENITKLREYDLQYADLHNIDLRGADFHNIDLRVADLHNADLRGADLRAADLREAELWRADLRGAELSGADIDFSCLPLWCGGLHIKIDVRIARQIAYHLCSMQCDDPEFLAVRNAMLPFANKFHRVEECGKLVEVE